MTQPTVQGTEPRTAMSVPVEDAAKRLVTILSAIADGEEPVELERNGLVVAAVISADDLADLRRLRELERQQAVLARLEQISLQLAATNQGVSDEEAEAFGKEMGKQVNRAVTARLARQRQPLDRTG